ncbi:hypothetical protein HG530_009426 [Fusarium avenaceum]|nr:hypothetical protein HG530_009426 [Fusarium avenaceum]
MEADNLSVPSLIISDSRIPHSLHHLGLTSITSLITRILGAVHVEDVERLARSLVPPTLFNGKGYNVVRASVVGVVLEVGWEILDVPRVKHLDIVGAEALSSPKFLATCHLPNYPSLILIRNEVRISAICRFTVLGHKIPNNINALPSSASSFHHDAGKVTVLHTMLRVGRHLKKLITVISPDVTNRYALLVQTTISQGRRKSFEVGVFHAHVSVCVVHLWDLHKLSRKGGIFRDTDSDG